MLSLSREFTYLAASHRLRVPACLSPGGGGKGERGALRRFLGGRQGRCASPVRWVGGDRLPPSCMPSLNSTHRVTYLQRQGVKGKGVRCVLPVRQEGKGPLCKRVGGWCQTTYLPAPGSRIQFAESLIFSGRLARGKGVKGCAARSARVCVCVLRRLRRGAEWVVPNYLHLPIHPPTLPAYLTQGHLSWHNLGYCMFPPNPSTTLATSPTVRPITPAERGANYYFPTLPEMDK